MGAQVQEKIDYGKLIRFFRIFGRHYRKYAGLLTVAVFSMLVGIGAGMLLPWPLALIIDHVLKGEPLPPALGFLGPVLTGGTPQLAVGLLAVAFVVIKIVQSIFTYLDKYYVSIVGEYMVADIRERIFAHLQRLSLAFHQGRESGDVIFRMTKDVKDIKKLLVNLPHDFGHSLFAIAGYGVVMVWMNWKLAVIAAAIVPTIYHFTRKTGTGVNKAEKKKNKKEGKVAHIVGENVRTMALVQAYGRQDSEREIFDRENLGSLEADLRTIRLSSGFKRLMDMLVAAGTAAVLYVGGRVVLDGDLSFGAFIVFYKYIDELYGPLDKLAAAVVSLSKHQVAGDRTLELIETDMVVRDRRRAVPAPEFEGRVELRGVSFAYAKGPRVLDSVDLVAEPGHTVALVGHSGAGKSTLISLLLRFYDPTEGEILIDGRDIRDFQLASLRSRMTIVLQEALLFRKTVRENIAFGRPGASEADVIRAAQLAQAHDFIEALPEGYDTVISEDGRNLSGGQRQRISIARAILRDTPIVILDEPSTGLDAESEANVSEAMARLTADRTTFVIAHRFATIRNADRILLLEEGRVAQQGTHEELLESSAEYKELYELQVGRSTAA